MKQVPALDAVARRMRPGVLTLHGFFGSDTRSLVDILAEDDRAVRERGLTHDRIAERLEELLEAARDIMERETVLEGRYRIFVRDDRGLITSPWGDGRFRKDDAQLVDLVTGTTLRWNSLSIHLIRTHGFYSGRESPYRLDPVTLIDVLQIRPDPERAPENEKGLP
jgi:hypothetical protein